MTKVIHKFVVALLVASFFAFPVMGTTSGVQAQDAFPPQLEPRLSADGLTLYNAVTPLVVIADPNPEMQDIRPAGFTADDALAAQAAATATFSITYVAAGGSDPWGETCLAFPAAAKTAFEAAAAIWATRLQSSVPITVQACWADLGSPSILGYSGGEPLHRDFSGAPKANTWYFGALANSLAGSDLEPSSYDDYITYNSGFSWYFGTDGNTPSGQYDLVSVAAHEIGHGLNFAGSASYSGGSGSLGQSGYPVVYDTYMEDGSGTALTSYTSPSAALGTALTSNDLWFDGPNANAANGSARVKMYAPSTWSGGSSYSHLDYNTFSGTPNALMVYAIGSGTARHDPGPVTMGLLKDLGWGTGSGSTVPTPTSPKGTISDTTPTYKWTAVSGATNYQYQLVKGTTLKYTKTVPASVCNSTTCSHTPTNILGFASYKWRVRAMVDGAWGAYSAYKYFKLSPVPTPLAPKGTISDKTPTYKWTKVDKATQYQFQLMKGTATVYTKTVAAGACGTTTCSNTPTTALAYASYKWRVRAMVGGVWKPYSAFKYFNIATPKPKAGFWDGNAMEFYVTTDQKNVDNFAIYVSVSGCGNYKITRTSPLNPIVNKKFSFTGTFYANGTFDSISKAHGQMGLKQFYIYGCGYVTGGPFSWNAIWINSSQPSSVVALEQGYLVEEVTADLISSDIYFYTIDDVVVP